MSTPPPRVTLNVRLPVALHHALVVLAKQERRSLNTMLLVLLESHPRVRRALATLPPDER